MTDKKRKESKKDYIRFNLEMGSNISTKEPLRVGRIPIPFDDGCPKCGHQIIGGYSYICSNCGYTHFSTFSNIEF